MRGGGTAAPVAEEDEGGGRGTVVGRREGAEEKAT